MNFEQYAGELYKAKCALEKLANDAEESGYAVSLQFNKDGDRERHKGRPHSLSIKLSQDVSKR